MVAKKILKTQNFKTEFKHIRCIKTSSGFNANTAHEHYIYTYFLDTLNKIYTFVE